MSEANKTPDVSWGEIMLGNIQSYAWAINHWMVIHLCGLRFCHSCSGYFREACMVIPDTCESCFACGWRDYLDHEQSS